MATLQAGKLDRRITIMAPVVGHSDSGAEIVTWSELATTWAQKIERSGNERFADRQLVGSSLCTFRFRWNSTNKQVTTEHQIIFDGRTHDILDVREIERRAGIEVDCSVRSEEPLAP